MNLNKIISIFLVSILSFQGTLIQAAGPNCSDQFTEIFHSTMVHEKFQDAYPKHLAQLKREMHQNHDVISGWRYKLLRSWAHLMMLKNRRFFPAHFVKEKVTLWSSIYAGRDRHQKKLSDIEFALVTAENELTALAVKRSGSPTDLLLASQLRETQAKVQKLTTDAKKLKELLESSVQNIQKMIQDYRQYYDQLNAEIDRQMTLYLRWKVLRSAAGYKIPLMKMIDRYVLQSDQREVEFPLIIELPTVKGGKISDGDTEVERFINPDRLEVTARSYEDQYKKRSAGIFSNYELRQIVERHTETHWALSVLYEFLDDATAKEEGGISSDQALLREIANLIDITYARRENNDPTFIRPSQHSQAHFAWKIAIEETKQYFSRLSPQVTKDYEDFHKAFESETDTKELSKRMGGLAIDELRRRVKNWAMASLLASSTLTAYFTGFNETLREYVEIPQTYIARAFHQLDPMAEVRLIVKSNPENFPVLLEKFVVRLYLKPADVATVSDLSLEKQTELNNIIFTINAERAFNEQKEELKKSHFKLIDDNFHSIQESYKELKIIKAIAETHDENPNKEISEFARKAKNFIRKMVVNTKLGAKRFSEQEKAIDSLLRLNPTSLSQGIQGTTLDPSTLDVLQKIGHQRQLALEARAKGANLPEPTLEDLQNYDPLADQYSQHILSEFGKIN